MIRLVYITTVPASANGFLRGQATYMRKRGFDVVVISAPGDELRILEEREKVTTIAVPMEREISPFKDLLSLVRLYTILRRLRPAIVNAGTPKAGLLGMIAACAAGVPARVYALHGLRLETTSGLKRLVLGVAERCAATLAHSVICCSESLRHLYVTLGLTTEAKARVLREGSANGVDIDEFTVTPERRDWAREWRARFGIPDGAPVVGFVGRLTRDKGVPELVDAFNQILPRFPSARLLMVGDFEEGDPVPERYVKQLRSHPRVIITGYVSDPALYYPIMDILALPSHREGLGTAVLEAAVAEIPAVAFRVTGSVDAVRDGVTGTLVPFGDVDAFARAVQRYLSDDTLRREHGQAGRERVMRHFCPEMIWEALAEEYARLLKSRDRILSRTSAFSPGNASEME
jgi:glycosyltransferase involved in cell wall biosynthesis